MKKILIKRRYKSRGMFADEVVVRSVAKKRVTYATKEGNVGWGWRETSETEEYVRLGDNVLFSASDVVKERGKAPQTLTIVKRIGGCWSETIEGSFDALLITFSPYLAEYASKRIPQKPKDIDALVSCLNRCADIEYRTNGSSGQIVFSLQSVG